MNSSSERCPENWDIGRVKGISLSNVLYSETSGYPKIKLYQAKDFETLLINSNIDPSNHVVEWFKVMIEKYPQVSALTFEEEKTNLNKPIDKEDACDKSPLREFKKMKGLEWNEVSICFVATEDVTIKARGITKRARYNDFYSGIDTRNSKPTSVWSALRMLAICEQTNNNKSALYKSIPDTKTAMKRVRKMLRESFDIKNSPIKNKSYDSVINLSIEEHVIKHLLSNTIPEDESISDIEVVMNNEQY